MEVKNDSAEGIWDNSTIQKMIKDLNKKKEAKQGLSAQKRGNKQ